MYNSQTQSSSFASLKRPRDEKQLPPLPKLTSELILQVYTHISLRRLSDDGPEEYGDNERLIELGKAVLDALITYVLFNRRPMLKVPELRVGPFISHNSRVQVDEVFVNQYQRNRVLSDENVENWVTTYGMRQRLRCHPDVFPTLSTSQVISSLIRLFDCHDHLLGSSFHFLLLRWWYLRRTWTRDRPGMDNPTARYRR
jgi:hypothetical protein